VRKSHGRKKTKKNGNEEKQIGFPLEHGTILP
jgi:hypothetical protein